MKLRKVAAGFMAAMMLFSLAGCSGNGGKSKKDSDDKSGAKKSKDYIELAEEMEEAMMEDISDYGYFRYEMLGIPGSLNIFDDSELCDLYIQYNDGDNNDVEFLWTYNEDKEMLLGISIRYYDPDEFQLLYRDEKGRTTASIEDFIYSFGEDYELYSGTYIVGENVGYPVQDDLDILYSRAVTMLEAAMEEYGYSFDDFGFEFGKKYLDTDPSTPLSFDFVPEIVEHNMVDGFCTICDENWIDCVGANVVAFDESYDGDNWSATTFNNKNKISTHDYTRFDYYTEDKDLLMMYVGLDDDLHLDCDLTFYSSSSENVMISFEYGGYMEQIDKGLVDYKDAYHVYIAIRAESLYDFMEDPEAFAQNMNVYQNNDELSEVPDEVLDAISEYMPTVIDAFEEDLNKMDMSFDDII